MLGDLTDVTGDGVMADPATVHVITPLREQIRRERRLLRRGFRSYVTLDNVRVLSTVDAREITERVNRLMAGDPA